jgi:hypothetical protein
MLASVAASGEPIAMSARRLVATAAAALLLLVAVRAGAEEDAKKVFERGTALFALHRFAEAALAYEKAFELRPDPAILYNAAQAHRLASNKPRALELYQSLLRLYGGQLDNRAEIEGHVAQLRTAIAAEQRAASSPPATVATPSRTPAAQPPPARVTAAPAKATPAPAAPAKATPAPARVTAPPPRVAVAARETRATPKETPSAPRETPIAPPPPQAATPPHVETSVTSPTLVVSAPPPRQPIRRKPWLWGVIAGGAALVIAGATVGIVLGTSKTVPPTPTFGTAQGN